MRKSQKIALALGLGAAALAGGTAFTGTGLATTAPSTQFLGGTVSQSVTGATLSGVDYAFADAPSNTEVNSITLTFADATGGKVPTVSLNSGSGTAFTCTAIDGTTFQATCTPATAGTYQTGLTSLAVTVS
ncbi:hypothetical protein SA2016_0916 [Sinomonas atrocyanea]|uniref:Uncharacterized protein n=1 Tax=Sinomonas atrocyanea TaxID=37927 RepID=A0A126ZYG3_9MICC|nr:hypothetical protein [Sinomonas atrocyanea]AMM31604.1 hypothetical protein SA2016_0916 [Sinomonas atrocyanea]GEB64256.1 hypothetical protein SAT01_17040 [Sinomonas atrocyanea]GGG57663.1 hypothetical protein GCM10007172_05650 [Sinomonas atrocyanea]